MEESGMLNYDTLFVLEQVWSGGRMVHTESVMFSFLFWFSFPLLPVHTKQPNSPTQIQATRHGR